MTATARKAGVRLQQLHRVDCILERVYDHVAVDQVLIEKLAEPGCKLIGDLDF